MILLNVTWAAQLFCTMTFALLLSPSKQPSSNVTRPEYLISSSRVMIRDLQFVPVKQPDLSVKKELLKYSLLT